jgi:Leucine-rich repeat (LRR) protein
MIERVAIFCVVLSTHVGISFAAPINEANALNRFAESQRPVVSLLRDLDLQVELGELAGPNRESGFFAGFVSGHVRDTESANVVARFAELKHLKRLELSGPGLRDEHFPESIVLADLTLLNLYGKSLTSNSIRFLKNSPRMREIRVNLTNLDEASLMMFSKMPDLTTLRVIATAIDEKALPHFAKLTNLKRLSIDDYFDSGVEMPDSKLLPIIAHLQSLESIILVGTEVSDEHLEELAKLPHLSRLDLSGTRVTAAGLPTLAKIKTLTHLTLDDLPLGDEHIDLFRQFQNLEKLSIRQKSDGFTRNGIERLKQLLPKAAANRIQSRFVK